MPDFKTYYESEIALGALRLKNPFIKSATYEGFVNEGMPRKGLIDHHVAIIKGGAAMTVVSYGAVSEEAKTFAEQMKIEERTLPFLKELANRVHDEGGKLAMQLTHCGYFSKNNNIKRPLSASRTFNAYGFLYGLGFSKSMDKEDLNKCVDDFVSAAKSIKEVGFDAIELHMGHGYLLSQFLSPRINKRKDDYGGNLENRCRFPLEVFSAIKEALGKKFPVLVKVNMNDGFKGGFSEEQCIYLLKELEKRSCDAAVLSGGFTSKTPFLFNERRDPPIKGMTENAENMAERLTMRLFAPWIIKKYDFTENFFEQQSKSMLSKLKLPIVYLGGADSADGITKLLDDGFSAIALARPLIHDADFLQKLSEGSIQKSGCTRCNECIVEMDKGGVRCTIKNHV